MHLEEELRLSRLTKALGSDHTRLLLSIDSVKICFGVPNAMRYRQPTRVSKGKDSDDCTLSKRHHRTSHRQASAVTSAETGVLQPRHNTLRPTTSIPTSSIDVLK